MDTRIHEQARALAAGRVERQEEEGDSVRYTNICLLAPGEWTDAASRTTIYYAPDAIKRSARNWVDNQVNLYHQPGDPVANVGHIDTDSVYADDEGALYGDVILHGRTQSSADAIGLMDLALETDGEQGVGGPSVEIPDDTTEWDGDRGMERMKEMAFSGAALVMHPASRKVSFEEQFENRAVALAEATEGNVALMTREETTKPDASQKGGMGTENPDDPLAELASAQNRIRELQRELQNPTDDLLAAIEAYNADEETEPDDDVEDFVAWAEEAGIPEEAVELARTADADDVSELQSWASTATTSEAEAEGEETPEENPEGEMEEPDESVGGDQPGPGGAAEDGSALPDETARAVASALDDVAATISAVQEAVEEEISGAQVEMEEARDEMQEELAAVKERVAELEDNSSAKSLADGTGDVSEDEEMLDAAASTVHTDGRYITR